MQRLSRSLRVSFPARAARASPIPLARAPIASIRPIAATYATKSSPKSAEKASAASGGSRSKGAVESGSVEAQKEKDSEKKPSSNESDADPLATPDARGKTGGGPPLKSSKNAPAKPKITNASIPGKGPDKLTPEQQKEVDEHNKDFDKKHDRASPAKDDQVDKAFWSGGGTRDAPKQGKEKEAAKKDGKK